MTFSQQQRLQDQISSQTIELQAMHALQQAQQHLQQVVSVPMMQGAAPKEFIFDIAVKVRMVPE